MRVGPGALLNRPLSQTKLSSDPVSPARHLSATPTSASDGGVDRVTLSQAAKDAATRAETDSSKRVDYGSYSAGVHAIGRYAEHVANVLAYTVDQPLVNMTDFYAGKGPVRYAATGEAVTAESAAQFHAQALQLRDARVAIYERATAKGTSATDILDELIAYMAKQPNDFVQHTGWKNIIPADR
jgi:hypothetical protein